MQLSFTPPGPVGAAFMDCRKPAKFIMGPVGSGKTGCLVMDTIFAAARQPRSKIDGVRYSKALFVRETFRQLYKTTIPSWWKWIPKTAGEWKGGGNEAASHHLRFQLPDQSIVDLIVLFEALGDNNVEDLMRGWEFNLLRLNEDDTLPPEVLDQGLIRLGQARYPGEIHVSAAECVSGVAGDYNAPDIYNYLYQLLEESRPADFGFFRQPGGRDPRAENLGHNGGLAAYEKMVGQLMARGRPDLVRRMIDNQYGFSRNGKPVYEEYRDDFHCGGEELQPVSGVKIRCDFDQGLHPACILRQNLPNGQVRVLDELYSDKGAKGLCKDLKELIGSDKYAGFTIAGGKCDPAGEARDGNEAESWIDCVNRLMGWTGPARVRAAQTNDPDKRQAAVRFRLETNVDDGRPGLLISTSCKELRRGFNSEYRFKKRKTSDGTSFEDAPEKKFPIADVHDALQYGALDNGGYEEVTGREERSKGAFGGGKMFTAKMAVRL